MANQQNELLQGLLKDVSRSFYLTLRVLPGRVRPQIGLAYLLARATDTIADTALVPLDRRLAALDRFRARILGKTAAPLEFHVFAVTQGTPAERVLLERGEAVLGLLGTLSNDDLGHVRHVLDIIASGQELDLHRFGSVRAGEVAALETPADLDDYTYRVAGCVGEFWTRICRAHLFPGANLDEPKLFADGVRFGKGLQLVNILRDLPRDVGQGRCYLPAIELAGQGLEPRDLLAPAAEPKLRPVYDDWLERAYAHLCAGWAYTNALPRTQVRVRLACAWPVLIGLRTIDLLRANPALGALVKITRSEVYTVMRRTVLLYPFASAWRRLGPTRPAVVRNHEPL